MSYSLDANILLYASDRTSDNHKKARKFLESCVESPEVLCLAWTTLMSYLQISTHPRIFSAPLTPAKAMENVAALLKQPQVRTISELDGFIEAYKLVCGGVLVRGNLVPDAHFATVLFQNGVTTLYTADRDFRRFEYLDVRDPFA